jgi:hypothetical protein
MVRNGRRMDCSLINGRKATPELLIDLQRGLLSKPKVPAWAMHGLDGCSTAAGTVRALYDDDDAPCPNAPAYNQQLHPLLILHCYRTFPLRTKLAELSSTNCQTPVCDGMILFRSGEKSIELLTFAAPGCSDPCALHS